MRTHRILFLSGVVVAIGMVIGCSSSDGSDLVGNPQPYSQTNPATPGATASSSSSSSGVATSSSSSSGTTTTTPTDAGVNAADAKADSGAKALGDRCEADAECGTGGICHRFLVAKKCTKKCDTAADCGGLTLCLKSGDDKLCAEL